MVRAANKAVDLKQSLSWTKRLSSGLSSHRSGKLRQTDFQQLFLSYSPFSHIYGSMPFIQDAAALLNVKNRSVVHVLYL
jgi:hypothetical protein